MITRVCIVAAVAVVACACAVSAPERGPQTSIYAVGDNAALLNANANTSSGPEGNFEVIKRIYWWFAGR
jgi:hypothetical protein